MWDSDSTNGFTDVFTYGRIQEVTASGILQQLDKQHLPLAPLKHVCQYVDDKVLVLEDLVSTFLVIITGFGLSTLVLTFELLFAKTGCFASDSAKDSNGMVKRRVREFNPNRLASTKRNISINGKVSKINVSSALADPDFIEKYYKNRMI